MSGLKVDKKKNITRDILTNKKVYIINLSFLPLVVDHSGKYSSEDDLAANVKPSVAE